MGRWIAFKQNVNPACGTSTVREEHIHIRKRSESWIGCARLIKSMPLSKKHGPLDLYHVLALNDLFLLNLAEKYRNDIRRLRESIHVVQSRKWFKSQPLRFATPLHGHCIVWWF